MQTPPLSQAVHFFNARGFSVLTEDHYLDEIDTLRAELGEAKQRITSLLMRLQALGDEIDTPGLED